MWESEYDLMLSEYGGHFVTGKLHRLCSSLAPCSPASCPLLPLKAVPLNDL